MGFLTFTKKALLGNERGISIVEGMVGLGAVAGLAAIIANISTNTNNRGLVYRRACESMAVNAIDAITDEGIYMNVHHFNPSNDGVIKQEITSGEGINLFTIDEIANGDLWPATVSIISPVINSGANLPPTVRNEALIQGAMRALNALYNNQSGVDYCSDFASYPQMSVANLGIENELTRSDPGTPPSIELQLQAVNWTTNTTVCPAKPFFVSPLSGAPKTMRAYNGYSYDSLENGVIAYPIDAPPSHSPDGIWNNNGEFGLTFKWRLSAKVKYTYQGENFECTMAREYQYPDDSTPPTLNDVSVSVVENPTRKVDYPDYSLCNSDPVESTVGIEITVTNVESGSLFFCRDISEEFVYDDPSSPGEAPASPMCYAGSGVSNATLGRVDPQENLTNPAYIDHLTAPAPETPSDDKWFPCHAARICSGVGGDANNAGEVAQPGIAPSSAVIIGGGSPTPEVMSDSDFPYTLSLTYNGVPEDCIINMQVIAVDIAGNISGRVVDHQVTSVVPVDGQILTPRGVMTNANSAADILFSDGAGTQVDASIASLNRQGMHRRWCGDRNGFAAGTIGDGANGTWGVEDEYGILCQPAPAGADVGTSGGPLTPNWEDGPLVGGINYAGTSTDTVPGLNIGLKVNANGNNNWTDEFPNGYYTCNPGGCCFGAGCRPFD